MKKFLLSFILLCSLLPLFAQGRFVKINTNDKKDDAVIKVSQTSEKTQIIGNISRTTVDLIVTNSSNRILEGEFEFPLEQGETVTGFALDINGKLRNAVAIEKEKGRQIFEEIVRRNVDPGLLEMTAGNNFKTRIYPIPAKGFRQIQIVYEKKLSAGSGKVRTDIAYTETIGKETFFYYYPNLSSIADKNNTKNKMPESIVVYYDVSDSGKNRNLEGELAFLENYISVTGAKKLEAVTFSNCIHQRKTFKSVKELTDFLKTQNFDGGTNLNLDFSKETAAQIIVVSDGLHNFSKEDGFYLSKNHNREKFVAVTSSASADYGILNQLANEVVNLNATSTKDAINQLTYRRIKLISASYDSSAFSQITPSSEYAISISDDFCISGILNKKSGTIKLSFGYEADKPVFVKEINVSAYETSECKEAENVSRLWAMEKIQELSLSYDANKTEIINLAKKYTVVTPDTSLLVLETVNDYVRYGVEPPAELREEYNRIAGRNVSTVKNETENQIPAEVYKNFEEYKAWWNKSPKDFKTGKKKTKSLDAPIIYNDMAPDTAYEEAADSFVMERGMAASETVNNSMRLMSAPAAANETAPSLEVEKKASVTLQVYNSNADYLTVLKKTPETKMYEKYLELKKDYSASPYFYMDVAGYFYEEGLKKDALRILSNLAEMNLENTDVLRALGYKLSDWKEYELACGIFKKLVGLRSQVPQFLRDLGLAYNNAGETQKAIDTLWQLASNKWDSRYSQIQQVALNDMNSIIARSKTKLDTSKMDKQLLENFAVDIRVVLTWNTDDCDVDLWVTDADGEKCFYGNKLTQNGGRMSRDFTQGYGPEEFAIKVAPNGKYKIQANYYANHQQKLLQPVIVQAEVYTNFGKPNQTCQIMTLQLNDVKNTFDIGEIKF